MTNLLPLSSSAARTVRALGGAVLGFLLGSAAAAQTTFPTSLPLPATVPDGDPFGLELSIPVAGLVEPIVGVDVHLTFEAPGHSWIGDLDAILFAPSFDIHTLFFRVGSVGGVGTGDSTNAVGPYTFSDRATGDLWLAAGALPNGAAVPAGRYRTVACCAPNAAGPGVLTAMDPVFLGQDGNGSWSLRVTDAFAGDTGSVAAASLTVYERSVAFAQSFTDDPVPAGGVGTLRFTLGAGAHLEFRSDLASALPGLAAVAVTPASDPCGAGSAVGLGSEVSLVSGTGPCSFEVTIAVPVDATPGGYPSITSTLVDAGPLPTLDDDVPVGLPATDTLLVGTASADVSVTKTDGMTTAIPGGPLTTTIVVANAGPSAAPTVTLTDILPAALACSWTSVPVGGVTGNTPAGTGDLAETLALPAGSSVTYALDCTIDPAANGTLVNTATVISSVNDPDPSNDTATDDDTVLAPTADLAISMTDGLAATRPDALLSFTIEASNEGPSDAPNTSVVGTFPVQLLDLQWTCQATVGSSCPAGGAGLLDANVDLAALGVATFTVTGTVDHSFVGTLVQTSAVTAAPGVVDVDPTNDVSTDETIVLSPALVRAEKSVDGELVPGGLVSYEIVLVNEADAAQFDDPGSRELVDELPAELVDVTASADAGTVAVDGRVVTWDGGIGAGEAITVLVEARIDPALTQGTWIENQGIFFFDADGDGVNDTETLTDDPTAPGGGPTSFFVQVQVTEIPTIGGTGLALLGLLLAVAGVLRLAPRRSAREDSR